MSAPASPDTHLPGWIPWLLPVTLAFLVRAARDYRPFPSVDHFIYVPMAWAANEPGLFANDLIMKEFILHSRLWAWIVTTLEATLGLANGFWLFTLALSVATVAAAYRLTRALGVDGLLFPLAVLVAFCGRIGGIGRGIYGGALGNEFHMQGLAICLLLWTYDAFIRKRAWLAGVLLGVTVAIHPVVGVHGAIVLTIASLFASDGRWWRLFKSGVACAVVSAPITLPLTEKLFLSSTALAWSASEIIEKGYLFRTPHEFTLDPIGPLAGLVMLNLVLAGGVGAWFLLTGSEVAKPTRPLVGLLVGQVTLIVVAVGFHGSWFPSEWQRASILPYVLSLTRTSPVLLVLSALLLVAAVESNLIKGRAAELARRILWSVLCLALVALLVITVQWNVYLMAVLLLAVTFLLLRPFKRILNGFWPVVALVGLSGLAVAATGDMKSAKISEPEAELFAWVREVTPVDALFIVPPGFQSFRFYTRRGVYVDFKTFPASTASLIPKWRSRLEQVTAPDRAARQSRGWGGLLAWERSYANRNTPSRIADLLQATGAHYFVWDANGLDIPPHVPAPRAADSRVTVAFTNQQFQVYRLRKGSDGN